MLVRDKAFRGNAFRDKASLVPANQQQWTFGVRRGQGRGGEPVPTPFRIAGHGQKCAETNRQCGRAADSRTNSRCFQKNLLRCLQKKRPRLCCPSRAGLSVGGSKVGLLGGAPAPLPPDFNVVCGRKGVFLSCKINARFCFRPRSSPFAPTTAAPRARPFKPPLKSGGAGGWPPVEKYSRSSRAFFLQTPDPLCASETKTLVFLHGD